VSQEELIRQIVVESKEQLAGFQPSDEKSLIEFKAVMTPAWKHSLQLEIPATPLWVETAGVHTSDTWVATTLALGRKDRGDRLPATLFSPQNDAQKIFVVLAHQNGQQAFLDGEARPIGVARRLLDHGASVLVFDAFQTGSLKTDDLPQPATLFTNFYTTYNRTPIQQRVQDLITACAYGRARNREGRLVLCGFDRAGPWALLAAPAADAVLADADGLESSNALALMDPELFSPGLLKYDSFQTAPLLGVPNPLFIHNTGSHFKTDRLRTAYAAMRAESRFRLHPEKLESAALADWILQLP
jgi:dienelactone hydrolase